MSPREIEDFLYASHSGIKDNLTTDSSATKGDSHIKRTRIDLNQLGNLKPGDHITWKRTYPIWHHAIVEEVNARNKTLKVIHLSKQGSQLIVHKKTVKFEKENGNLYRIDYTGNERLSPEETLKRARVWLDTRFRNKRYNLFTNNCEHFATYCVTGKGQSNQTKEAVEKAGIGFGEAILISTPHVIKSVKTRLNKSNDKLNINARNETQRSSNSHAAKPNNPLINKQSTTKPKTATKDASPSWCSSTDSHGLSSRSKRNKDSKGKSMSSGHVSDLRDESISKRISVSDGISALRRRRSDLLPSSIRNNASKGKQKSSSDSDIWHGLSAFSMQTSDYKSALTSSNHSSNRQDLSPRSKTYDYEDKSTFSSYSNEPSKATQSNDSGKGSASLIAAVGGTGGIAVAVKKTSVASVVKKKVFERVSKARETLKGVGWKATAVTTAAAAGIEVVSSIYDIHKLYKSKKKGDISQSDFIESTTQRVVEGTCAVGGAAAGGFIGGFVGSWLCPGVGTVIGSLIGSFLGDVVSRVVGRWAGSKVGKFFSSLFS
ncbi:uncharacterized protein LOC127853555 [Dreissena polymorpha]|uniref:LRAT domain-containing protein n=1 Tax=Dreissena polymorpha TaxID=45954 RepID=A0A9D4CMI2_DREPO|nr:uncharacterized protein LOC127853555 [Dreissena polymorpha]XP_052244106.1 uncharacterized protein LOC127853555 [Dreissena polymorpha]KAH3727103.1 hypothetical protein DPMN_053028 [Dreissena polymorpha]